MRKIRYVIPKREMFLYILMLLLPISFMYLFSFDMRFNLKYGIFYTYRYILYIFCFIFCFWNYFFSHLIIHYFLIVIKLDEEKFVISSPFRKKTGNIPFKSITKLIVNKKFIKIFFIKNNNNDLDNLDNNKENNEIDIIIPLIMGGVIHKEDFLYIMNTFKDIEIVYDNVTQDEILNIISKKQIYKYRIGVIFAYIACIGILFGLLSNLFFIFLFILCKIY
ncbi:hypothetical protein SDC9_124327 [bioreactor metagenome]|uniref:Uncharacterized protein n=1 Tax=bioreactor metagenome TaxID=1076179 RepID=A0A645CK57_9ZZZZ|nr:hypothetical protein [Candidatus Metalachnospira sp.]